MNEVLLSRPIIESIGFLLDLHLDKVCEIFYDTKISHVRL